MKQTDIANTEGEARYLRVLQVLELVAAATQPITAAQLGMRLKIPKASLARIVESLVENNYLMKIAGRNRHPFCIKYFCFPISINMMPDRNNNAILYKNIFDLKVKWR